LSYVESKLLIKTGKRLIVREILGIIFALIDSMNTPKFTLGNNTLHSLSINSFGEKFFPEINATAFSVQDSNTVYNSYFRGANFEPEKMYIICGTDSGLFVEYAKKNIGKYNKIVFVEFPEIIEKLETVIDLAGFEDQIAICEFDQWLKCAEQFNFNGYVFRDAITSLQSIGAADALLPQYIELWSAINSDVKSHVIRVAAALGSQAFITEQMATITENQVPAKHLENIFRGKPCLLIGGGPSFDEHIDWVKNNREYFVLIAVSRISRRLQEVGIQPDVIMAIDPQRIAYEVCREALLFKDTLLIHSFHTNHMLVGQWQGPSLFLGWQYPWKSGEDVLKNINVCPPTVMNTALVSSYFLGFSKVYLLGLDLSLSKEGHTHTKGSFEREVGPLINEIGAYVETYNGDTAETTPDYKLAIDNIASLVPQLTKNGMKLINIAPQAAKIDGIQYMSSKEISFSEEDKPKFKQVFKQQIPQLNNKEKADYYKFLRKECMNIMRQLRDVKTLTEKALKCNDGICGRNGMEQDFRYKKEMDKIEEQLNTKYSEASNFIKVYCLGNFFKIWWPDKDDEEIDVDEMYQAGHDYYASYRDNTTEVIEIMEHTLQRINIRLEEEKPQPNFKNIFPQWKKDEQPGRAIIWRKQHPDIFESLDNETKDEFSKFELEFRNSISKPDTKREKDLKLARHNLHGLKAKILFLLRNKMTTKLEALAVTLTTIDSEEARENLLLVEGCIAELKGNFPLALDKYKLITSTNLNIESIKRSLNIYMEQKDLENAARVMQDVVEIIPSFIPQYADLLFILGNRDQALDLLTEYCQKYPDDLPIMLKLGRLYQRIGVQEAANWVYNYVLEKQPDNSTAKTYLAELKNAS